MNAEGAVSFAADIPPLFREKDIPSMARHCDLTSFEGGATDRSSTSRIDKGRDPQVRVIVVWAEGYSSSLAAASLQDIGIVNATDVIGGFEAWKAAGLPVTPLASAGASSKPIRRSSGPSH